MYFSFSLSVAFQTLFLSAFHLYLLFLCYNSFFKLFSSRLHVWQRAAKQNCDAADIPSLALPMTQKVAFLIERNSFGKIFIYCQIIYCVQLNFSKTKCQHKKVFLFCGRKNVCRYRVFS
jgi:hypothetical protein